jgi:glutathione synthase/RimK-type ligase-like ATP-grasp enzyme
MNILLVVNDLKDWPLEIPGVAVIPARSYLTDQRYFDNRAAKVFNLCRSYKYQSAGYYVSLLAAARGHHPIPSLATIQDLRSAPVARLLSEDLEDTIQKAFKGEACAQVSLDVVFGRHPDPRFDRLAWSLYSLFEAPLLRVDFACKEKEWQLRNIRALGASDLAAVDHDFVLQAASEYFSGKRRRARRKPQSRYDLAILHDPNEAMPPSNKRALARFESAAEALDMGVEFITREDAGRLAEFDALFIRETTAVNHHTFRMARRAQAEGLVVIDDPDSILKCTNKVYLAELLTRHKIPSPKTLIVHAGNVDDIVPTLGMPVVLKLPDSSFSAGVTKVDKAEEIRDRVRAALTQSELIVAQEFVPTDYDWRVGIIDRRPIYVSRYYMARRHWQIVRRDANGATVEGTADSLAVEDAPQDVVQIALKAANLIGNGLYGVDLKQVDGKIYVIEINDNPSIDAGYEDAVRKGDLYRDIMSVVLARIEAGKRTPAAP